MVFAIDSVMEIKNEQNLELARTQKGYTTFFEIFSGPLKLLTGAVTLIFLYVTFFRMEQSSKQLEEMKNNNQFKNYYLHKDAFLKDFNNFPFYELLVNLNAKLMTSNDYGATHDFFSRNDPWIVQFVNRVHGYFYGNRPDLFSLQISEKAKWNLSRSYGVRGLDPRHQDELENNPKGIIPNEFESFFNIITQEETLIENRSLMNKEEDEFSMELLNNYYYLAILYMSILEYQNENIPEGIVSFISLMNESRAQMGLTIIKGSHGIPIQKN